LGVGIGFLKTGKPRVVESARTDGGERTLSPGRRSVAEESSAYIDRLHVSILDTYQVPEYLLDCRNLLDLEDSSYVERSPFH